MQWMAPPPPSPIPLAPSGGDGGRGPLRGGVRGGAAVAPRRVVDELVEARLRVDLHNAGVDLRRVREREVAELRLLVRHLERRPVNEAAVHLPRGPGGAAGVR